MHVLARRIFFARLIANRSLALSLERLTDPGSDKQRQAERGGCIANAGVHVLRRQNRGLGFLAALAKLLEIIILLPDRWRGSTQLRPSIQSPLC
jgi:hypothetical protein